MESVRKLRMWAGRRRWVVRGAAAGSGMVALLLLAVPVASATALGVGTHVAPYTGTVVVKDNLYEAIGCGKAKLIKTAFWSSTTGVGGFASSGSAKTCTKTLGTVGAFGLGFAESEFDLAMPVKVPTGTHTFDSNFTFTATGSEAIHLAGHCPPAKVTSSGFSYEFCFVFAETFVSAEAVLFDASNGTFVGFGFASLFNYSEVYNDTTCFSGSCSYSNFSTPSTSGSFSGSTSMDALVTPFYSLVGSHKYVLELFVFGGSEGYVDGSPAPGYLGSTAIATMNAGTLGNGVTLNFVTIT